jgi:hypothetical protein
MALSTLFSASPLLMSIFAICFLAISLQTAPRTHWLSWSAANLFPALSLICFALVV